MRSRKSGQRGRGSQGGKGRKRRVRAGPEEKEYLIPGTDFCSFIQQQF